MYIYIYIYIYTHTHTHDDLIITPCGHCYSAALWKAKLAKVGCRIQAVITSTEKMLRPWSQQARQLTPRRGAVAHLGDRGCCVHIRTGNLSTYVRSYCLMISSMASLMKAGCSRVLYLVCFVTVFLSLGHV